MRREAKRRTKIHPVRDVGVGTLPAPYRGAVVVLADTDRP
jgi:hypothetical protein